MLPAVLRTETSAAEDENHRILSLQFGKLSAFGRVIRKFVIRKHSPWNNVRSHMNITFFSLEHSNLQREEPRKFRTNAVISSAAVSNAKWPASRRWTSAFGTSLR